MTGYFTRPLSGAMRVAFAVAGVMLMLPHQASQVMLWINVLGAALGSALVAYEIKEKRRLAVA
ncbi:MAG: hypothetical protein ACREVR_08230 [Burkholderiales bacterium]